MYVFDIMYILCVCFCVQKSATSFIDKVVLFCPFGSSYFSRPLLSLALFTFLFFSKPKCQMPNDERRRTMKKNSKKKKKYISLSLTCSVFFFTLMYRRVLARINYQQCISRATLNRKRTNRSTTRVINQSKRTIITKMGSGGEGEKKAKIMEEEAFENKLRVKKLSEHATIPVRGSDGAAGYDLSAAYDCVVKAKSKELVKTDLSIAIPKNTYARIAPRSGLAYKKFIDVLAGVVDYDYRGNVGVILANFGDEDFEVKKGDRVAQMILERITTPECVEVEDLEATERGAGGFGSTGVSK